MRKSRLATAETRRRIIDAAARKFRAHGIQATALADLMAEAGLTDGGFYRHFRSKDQLIAEACAAGVSDIEGLFEIAAARAEAKQELNAIVESYLSTWHRDNPADGCPFAGMGSELMRADDPARAIATRGFNDLVDLISLHLRRRRPKAARAEAVLALSAMIGAVIVSRIMVESYESSAVLKDVRDCTESM